MLNELTAKDIPALATLIAEAGLPAADISSAQWLVLLGQYEDEILVASGGIERTGDDLLLRSLVTHPRWRGRGLAGSIVNQLHRRTAASGQCETWLLTETAADYFGRHGYAAVSRDSAPAGIRASTQFSGLCPASATLMCRRGNSVASEVCTNYTSGVEPR